MLPAHLANLPLPNRLLHHLLDLAKRYHAEGLDLFIFGSFARGDQKPTSDLDLGVEWHTERQKDVFSRLYWEVDDLPTIRQIDLVDFSEVDAKFKKIAGAKKLYLLDREVQDNGRGNEKSLA